MRFVRSMCGCDFLFFLLTGRAEFEQILRALQFLVFSFELREIGNVLCFGFGKLGC